MAIDHGSDADRVQLFQVLADPHGGQGRPADAEVIVGVDGREASLEDEHRPRLPVAELPLAEVLLREGGTRTGRGSWGPTGSSGVVGARPSAGSPAGSGPIVPSPGPFAAIGPMTGRPIWDILRR